MSDEFVNLDPGRRCETCAHSLRWADGETLECRFTLPPWLRQPPRIDRTVNPHQWCSFWTVKPARITGTGG